MWCYLFSFSYLLSAVSFQVLITLPYKCFCVCFFFVIPVVDYSGTDIFKSSSYLWTAFLQSLLSWHMLHSAYKFNWYKLNQQPLESKTDALWNWTKNKRNWLSPAQHHLKTLIHLALGKSFFPYSHSYISLVLPCLICSTHFHLGNSHLDLAPTCNAQHCWPLLSEFSSGLCSASTFWDEFLIIHVSFEVSFGIATFASRDFSFLSVVALNLRQKYVLIK